jgi:hypothetical protein
MIEPNQIPKIPETAQNPYPLGEQHCNKREAYKSEVIHSPSTGKPQTVDNSSFFIHSFTELSTDSVDNHPNLWIKSKKLVCHVGMYVHCGYNSGDNFVDNRGKICG